MRFAAIAVATGLVGTLFAAYVQGTASSLVAGVEAETLDIDHIRTGSLAGDDGAAPDAIRLIDLRSGTSCRTAAAAPVGVTFTQAPLAGACASSPSLARIAQWRAREDGGLVMADGRGATVLEFVPGDGVLYESVFPADQLITIVPARG